MEISGRGTRTIRDVLVGEVWVIGGQREMNLHFPEGAAVRQYEVPRRYSLELLDDAMGAVERSVGGERGLQCSSCGNFEELLAGNAG